VASSPCHPLCGTLVRKCCSANTGPPRPSGLYLSPATSSDADADARRTILAVVESDQVKAAGLANAQLEREHSANMTLQVVILRHVSQ
jgi:hypothetical protein